MMALRYVMYFWFVNDVTLPIVRVLIPLLRGCGLLQTTAGASAKTRRVLHVRGGG